MKPSPREYTPALTIGAITAKPPKTAPQNRNCAACNKPLSIYNHETTCAPCERKTRLKHAP